MCSSRDCDQWDQNSRYSDSVVRLIFVYSMVAILLMFHGVVLSFFIPQAFDLSLGGKIYGALLIGIPTFVVDILVIRHFGGQFFERRWIAENKRRHEDRDAPRISRPAGPFRKITI